MRLLLPLILSFAALCTSAIHGEDILVVTGTAELDVPADQFSLRLGVTAAAPDVSAARQQVDTAMHALASTVESLGFERHAEWRTARYDISPQWKPRPRNASSDWKPEIVGYRVNSAVNVTSQKMDLAGKLIAEASKSGANEIGALRFSLADPRASRKEAIQTATRYALADAHTLAEAAHVRLVRVQHLSLDHASASTPRPVEYGWAAGAPRMAMDKEAAPNIAGGTITVTANVTARWDIAPADGAMHTRYTPSDGQDSDQ